jgi:hypothetical protein
MLDLLFVAVTVAYFTVNVAVAYGFDQLMGGKR